MPHMSDCWLSGEESEVTEKTQCNCFNGLQDVMRNYYECHDGRSAILSDGCKLLRRADNAIQVLRRKINFPEEELKYDI